MTPDGWRQSPVRELLVGITTGVSVNSEGRPRGPGEVGVLKTSAVTYGVFRHDENKVVVRKDLPRVREHPKRGCVLLSRMNTPALVGASAYVERDWPDLVLPDRIWQLQPNVDRIDGRWLFHLLSAPDTRAALSELASGTSGSMKNLAQEKFMGLRLAVPSLREQRKIATILSSLDDAIEATQAVIDQLAVVKKAMMAELLTRGLPGRHTRFKMTELGEVPESWDVVSVAEVGPGDRPTAQTGPFGAQLRPEDFVDSGVPVLKIGNVRWGRLDLANLDHVSARKARDLARFQVRAGDLLFARQGATTGRNALADERCEGWVINYHIIRVATDHARCLPRYLMTCFNSDLVQKQVGREKGRGNRDGINTENILGFRMPLPTLSEQAQITEALARIEAAVVANEHQVAILQRVKAALMSVVLTGEVRVTPDDEAA
jgi:type I restriction enzyme, S subunit